MMFLILVLRLYFKSLSNNETDKEKFFLVLQVSTLFLCLVKRVLHCLAWLREALKELEILLWLFI